MSLVRRKRMNRFALRSVSRWWGRLLERSSGLAALGLGGVLTISPGASSAQIPDAQIDNGLIHASLHLPDPMHGFYRGTRFDWSGIIGSLRYSGHDYYGPWFTRTDPKIADFIFDGPDIIAGPCSAATGPAEDFLTNGEALGFSEAPAGGTFLKIGVGVLRKPDNAKYSMFRQYEIVDHGQWSVQEKPRSVEFTQKVMDPSSGFGYLYRKTVRLVDGKPEMVIEHHLTNIGRRPLETSVYDHNFLVLDHRETGPDFVVTLPFTIHLDNPPGSKLGFVEGRKILYRQELRGRDVFAIDIGGFRNTAEDYEVTIENRKAEAGMTIKGDRPLEQEHLWSIRSTLAVEPFVHMRIDTGNTFDWKYTYTYFSLGK